MRTAITGGIGEGKSTVLRYLQEGGHDVLSSDTVAREVMEEEAVRFLLTQEHGLPKDRDALRQRIAEDPLARKIVNRVLHPRIVQKLQNSPARFIEVPLLLEVCLQGAFDRVWVVTCGPDEQRRRLLARYGDIAHTNAILRTQLPTIAKIPFSDVIVRTNESEERVREIVLGLAGEG